MTNDLMTAFPVHRGQTDAMECGIDAKKKDLFSTGKVQIFDKATEG